MNVDPAEFRKSDLQVHTARDANWGGSRPIEDENGGGLNSAREAWANDFIDACLKVGLQVVAITDHHEGVLCWTIIEQLRSRQESEEVDLWVLPGMELTSKDSAQALLIFDADIGENLFEKARSRLGLVSDCQPDSPVGIDVSIIDTNVVDIHDNLYSDPELQDRFIVLPNVTPGGHKTIMRKGFHTRFREMKYVGGYLDAKYPADLEEGDLKILNGEIPDWSSQPKGVVTTSDARDSAYSKLGKFPTWIKLATPTAESLRQAMLAADSRLKYELPTPPAVYIESVEVVGSSVIDITESLQFSPQYNALIGGRGAGKSTLLEYIRFALGRSAADEDSSRDWDPTFVRREGILVKTLDLEEGLVRLNLRNDGAAISVSRSRSADDRIEYVVGGESRIISPQDLRGLIPFQPYSQGELSLLGEDNASRKLFELITGPDESRFSELASRRRQTLSELETQLDIVVRGWSASQELRRSEAERDTLSAQMKSLRDQMKSSGAEVPAVIAERREILDTQEWFQKLKSQTLSKFEIAIDGLRDLVVTFESLSSDGPVPSNESAQDAARLVQETAEVLRDLSRRVRSEAPAFVGKMEPIESKWKNTLDAHNISYNQALELLSGARKASDEISAIQSNILKIDVEIDSHQSVQKQGSLASQEIERLSSALMSLDDGRIELTAQIAERVGPMSHGLAEADLDPNGDPSDLRDAIDVLFEGTGVRSDRKDSLTAHIAQSENPAATWWKLVDELKSVLRWNTVGLSDTSDRPELELLDAYVDPGGMIRLLTRMSKDRLKTMMRASITPKFRVFQDKENTRLFLDDLSQGERATILLALLMNQPGGPLIIDQPEEDLDNRVINDIVDMTRTAKSSRQLIFATHNANMVVNGDAELVVNLVGGLPEAAGAIDISQVRDAITETMEGGRDAFELRRQKYNF